jgi:hypothetical protein
LSLKLLSTVSAKVTPLGGSGVSIYLFFQVQHMYTVSKQPHWAVGVFLVGGVYLIGASRLSIATVQKQHRNGGSGVAYSYITFVSSTVSVTPLGSGAAYFQVQLCPSSAQHCLLVHHKNGRRRLLSSRKPVVRGTLRYRAIRLRSGAGGWPLLFTPPHIICPTSQLELRIGDGALFGLLPKTPLQWKLMLLNWWSEWWQTLHLQQCWSWRHLHLSSNFSSNATHQWRRWLSTCTLDKV